MDVLGPLEEQPGLLAFEPSLQPSDFLLTLSLVVALYQFPKRKTARLNTQLLLSLVLSLLNLFAFTLVLVHCILLSNKYLLPHYQLLASRHYD